MMPAFSSVSAEHLLWLSLETDDRWRITRISFYEHVFRYCSLEGRYAMPRTSTKPASLATITARRNALLAELARVEEQAKAAEEAARDAGRPVLLAALERIKIAAISRSDARTIAAALAARGGKAVAEHLVSISSE